MSVRDVIKHSFLEGFNNSIPGIKVMLLCLVISILLGIYVYLVYRICSKGSFYSSDFGLSLVMVSLITCAIILTIQSSVIVSLGMVGALSIVRFRTAVKNSVDLAYLYWAICVGIITGTGLIGLAVLVSFLISLIMITFKYAPSPKRNMYFVRVEAEDTNSLKSLEECISNVDSHYVINSQDVNAKRFSVTFEVHCDKIGNLITELHKCEGVISASSVVHGDNTNI